MKYIHDTIRDTYIHAMHVNKSLGNVAVPDPGIVRTPVHHTTMDIIIDYDNLNGMVRFRCVIGNRLWEHL